MSDRPGAHEARRRAGIRERGKEVCNRPGRLKIKANPKMVRSMLKKRCG